MAAHQRGETAGLLARAVAGTALGAAAAAVAGDVLTAGLLCSFFPLAPGYLIARLLTPSAGPDPRRVRGVGWASAGVYAGMFVGLCS